MKSRGVVLFVLLLLATVADMANAKGVFKRYPIKSGMIFYDINTTGQMPGMITKTTGIARLVFDDWGAIELKEEDATETQIGDFNETRDLHTMTKFDRGTIYTVDFEDHTIYKTRDRSIDISMAEGEDMSNDTLEMIKEMKGIRVGESEVAGFKCDVWKTKDQKICLYKGIPLKISIDQPGFHSDRVALQIVINKPIPFDAFRLPNFPIIVDEEYTSNKAAQVRTEDYIASVEDLKAKMKSLGIDKIDSNSTLTSVQERAIIDTLGARYLKKQKRLLPKLIVAIDGAKRCIKDAKDADEAKDCIKPVNRIDEELGDRTENFDFSNFDEDKRNVILDSLSNELYYLKVTNDCVQKHNKTSEVVECTEGKLGDDEGK